jgi:hypothetical protein
VNERKQCEFFLIRYVPDAVRKEFVNIGVLLREAGGGRGQGPMLRFTRDWARVRCADPDADIEMLEALEGRRDREPVGGLCGASQAAGGGEEDGAGGDSCDDADAV